MDSKKSVGYAIGDLGINLYFISSKIFLLYFVYRCAENLAGGCCGRIASSPGGGCHYRSDDGRHR